MALATEKRLINSLTTSNTNAPTKLSSCNLTISSTDLWHQRLGHVSPSCLSFIAKQFLNVSVNPNNACQISPLAKQSRLPFGTSCISSVKPFDIIHCDILGRYKHPSLSGAHYFLTIVDDYTRFTWAFLISHKDETQSLLKHFFAFVTTQFSSHIKTFRSDNGAEFISLQSFFKNNGVVFQHSSFPRLNKTGLWSVSIAIFCRLHEHLNFMLISFLNFGERCPHCRSPY